VRSGFQRATNTYRSQRNAKLPIFPSSALRDAIRKCVLLTCGRQTSRQREQLVNLEIMYASLIDNPRDLMANPDASMHDSHFPSPDRRAKLRRDILKLARMFPPGPERNNLRSIARSLTFFGKRQQVTSKGNAVCCLLQPST